ncbi:LysR family substrate-binding domain-containing protein [Streptomyces lasalocidi]
MLAAERRARAAVADYTAARGERLRVGTSTGMGDRLDQVLEALAGLAPGLRVELASAPTAVRLEQVARGELDAAFVRGVEEGPDGVRLVPVWQDRLLVVLGARHVLARQSRVELGELAGLPLYLTARRNNPPLVDLVVGACRDAGFEPVAGHGGELVAGHPGGAGRGQPRLERGVRLARRATGHRAGRLPAGE